MEKKSKYRYLLLGIGFLLSVSTIPIWVTPSTAQKVTFKPSDISAPTQTSGGASRGICGADKTGSVIDNMKAVIPSNNIGLTMAERPQGIYVYIEPNTAKEAVFSMVDEKGNEYYMTTLNLPDKAGVMEIKLPDSLPALQMNKNYKWSVLMICGEELDADSPAIDGWIRRVEGDRNLINQTNQVASLDLVSELANNSVWYETVSLLAKLKQEQPSNPAVNTAWQQVLTSVGLEPIANAPIIEVQQQ
ncbi:MAG: DUF928 domain-containing protein [Nostocaceae cyanobacterium]|nr:DUF928 domain-containing protein [Nostocaceae cyanobacterium]